MYSWTTVETLNFKTSLSYLLNIVSSWFFFTYFIFKHYFLFTKRVMVSLYALRALAAGNTGQDNKWIKKQKLQRILSYSESSRWTNFSPTC